MIIINHKKTLKTVNNTDIKHHRKRSKEKISENFTVYLTVGGVLWHLRLYWSLSCVHLTETVWLKRFPRQVEGSD